MALKARKDSGLGLSWTRSRCLYREGKGRISGLPKGLSLTLTSGLGENVEVMGDHTSLSQAETLVLPCSTLA